MRMTRVLIISSMYCVLLGCTATNPTHSTTIPPKQSIQKKKDPIEVSFYPNEKTLNTPYTVIGEAVVSKYNKGGIKRQDATIHEAMRTKAASMGGDAIIEVKRTDDVVVGKVIAYQTKTVKTMV